MLSKITFVLFMVSTIGFIALNPRIEANVVKYEQRRIYYNEDDNICAHGNKDQYNLTINFDDRQTKQTIIVANSFCKLDALTKADAISVSDKVEYLNCHEGEKNQCDYLIMFQEMKRTIIFPVFYSIHTHVTIKQDALFDGNIYECEINSNDEVYHFGPTSSGVHEAPKLDVFCKRKQNN